MKRHLHWLLIFGVPAVLIWVVGGLALSLIGSMAEGNDLLKEQWSYLSENAALPWIVALTGLFPLVMGLMGYFRGWSLANLWAQAKTEYKRQRWNWSQLTNGQRKLFLLLFGFVLVLKFLHILLMPVSGDEASFIYAHFRLNPLVPLLKVNNHPLHLFLGSTLYQLGIPDRLSVRLPAMLASLGLGLLLFRWTLPRLRYGVALAAFLFVQALGPLYMYSLDGKGYLGAALFFTLSVLIGESAPAALNQYRKALVALGIWWAIWMNPGALLLVIGIMMHWGWGAIRGEEGRKSLLFAGVLGLIAGAWVLVPGFALFSEEWLAGIGGAGNPPGQWLSRLIAFGGPVFGTWPGALWLNALAWLATLLMPIWLWQKFPSARSLIRGSALSLGFALLALIVLGFAPGRLLVPWTALALILWLSFIVSLPKPEQLTRLSRAAVLLGFGLFVLNYVGTIRELPAREAEEEAYAEMQEWLNRQKPTDQPVMLQSWQLETMLTYYYWEADKASPPCEVGLPETPPAAVVVLDNYLPAPEWSSTISEFDLETETFRLVDLRGRRAN